MDLYDWPAELPQDAYTDSGPTIAPDSNVIRTAMTTGPAKVRRRFTATTSQIAITLEMSEADTAILEDFVINKLNEVDQFNWKKFDTDGEPAVYRFPDGWSSVKKQWYGEDVWTVTMALELMP
jgi:hypothetical protein